ncbi:LIP-domain-containing protein [Microthyrium microscopicum]|uniref:LIP-domain-containing protein n=1 Tax=Microthyrium microscopicum TaxID=703497 RepID=A0A6A6UHC0_9PEZI|nr:LIP-domain-containing protein [Microthyrium microscopicum]
MASSYLLRVAVYCCSFCTVSFAYQSTSEASTIVSRDPNNSQILPPSQDPFYSTPSGYKNAAPGSILRQRMTPGNLTAITGNCSSSYQLLYRTTDSNHQPAWAVTTLFIPHMRNDTNHASLLSYQIPYDAASIDGGPSYLMYTGGFPDIGIALGQGWVVNVPDFEGSHAAFGLGISSGYSVLDSIRAVQSLIPNVISKQPQAKTTIPSIRTALWGYSGGSIASLWALELHAGYASDLPLHGAAVGGVVTNMTSTLDEITGTFSAGLMPSVLLGITAEDPTARAELVSQLKPENASILLSALDMNYYQAAAAFNNQDVVADYFKKDLASVLAQPTIKHIIDNNGYLGYHGIPQVPLCVYKAIGDELAPVKETDHLIEDVYCQVGVDVRYERNTIGGHISENSNGIARSRQFLTSVLEGTDQGEVAPVGAGCTVVNVTIGTTTTPP